MITTYAELKTSVGNWLARGDLAAVIPDFIMLAERDITRNLRNAVVREALTLDSGAVTLPTTVAELRSVRLNEASYQQHLKASTSQGLSNSRPDSGTGLPRRYAVVNGVLLLAPAPDASYMAEIEYFAKLVPLSDVSQTNATLTNSPDLYLYGALLAAEPYLEHDERVAVWQSKYDKALFDENNARERAELGGAPLPISLPFVIG